jgi:cysteine desulfurase
VIYLDYNATTPVCETARTAMLPFLEGKFGNPSSIHAAGRETRAAIDDARDRLADLLGAKPHELIFTSGGTEANNLAILGLARLRAGRGKHLISAKTEHHAVLNTIEYLEKREGFEVTWLNVSQAGRIDLDHLTDAIRDDTVLVSVMRANNETGVIQPLREIAEICRGRGVLLHSDMVQSFGKIPITGTAPVIPSENASPARTEGSRHENFKVTQRDPSTSLRSGRDDLGTLVDAASFAAHKFYGPKGAGLLFLRSGIPIEPIHFGGAHENERRPGTENVAAIAGMAAAAEFVERDREQEQAREGNLRDQLWQKISVQISPVVLNGDIHRRLANTLNVSLPALDSETMLMALDLDGVCASSGSACMVGSVVASHVLLAMDLPLTHARSAIRFSLGKYTTAEEVSATAGIVSEIVKRTNARRSEKAVAV